MFTQSVTRTVLLTLVALSITLSVIPFALADSHETPSLLYLPIAEHGLPVRDYIALVTSSADGDSEIYSLRGDGSELNRLTENEVSDEQPRWSPDGKQILWVRFAGFFPNTTYDNLWLMDSDGSNARPLTQQPGLERGSWSPAGTHIFYYNRANTGDLYTAFSLYSSTPDGAVTEITTGTYLSDYRWSPDGTSLLLLLVRRIDTGIVTDLHTVNADGTALRLIAQDVRKAAWSPAGDWLAFDARRNGDENVYLARPDGSEVLRITGNDMQDRFAGWVEGGARLLVKRTETDWSLGRYYLVTADGDAPEPFIMGAPGDDYLNIEGIAPDGEAVVFSTVTEQGYLYLDWQPVDRTTSTRISPANCAAACGVQSVAWSTDGSTIVYSFWQQPLPRIYDSQVYLVTLSGENPTYRLFDDDAIAPVWLPGAHYFALDAAPEDGDASVRVPHTASTRRGSPSPVPFVEGADFTTVDWKYAP